MNSRRAALLLIALMVGQARADDKPPAKGTTVSNSFGMKLKLIKAGSFQMGNPGTYSTPNRFRARELDEKEKPQHTVRISRDYFMGVTEVTQGQWEAVVGTRPWEGQAYVNEGPKHPATWVSWEDAVMFCKRLSEKEKMTYRLPTEAEWEYACRAGTTTEYSFGDDLTALKDYAWFYGNAFDRGRGYSHQVGTKRPNPWGLYDMHGNLREYCQDRFGAYGGSAIDPTGPSGGTSRVVRGGCFMFAFCTSSDRHFVSPSHRHSGFSGFRVVRNLLPANRPASEAKREIR
jgi:formylglycine-generating enzyme required for sulfatase activity